MRARHDGAARAATSSVWRIVDPRQGKEGRKRWHDADTLMADIVAKRLIRYLERARYVVMQRPPIGGSAPLNPPASYPQTKPEDLK